jgi:hypothetical protein
MDEYLIGRAHEAGRSVSEEIEARLERSFYMDGIMFTLAGDAQPLLNAVTTAIAFSLLQGPYGTDRYRVMQAAVGYIIAAFGSSNTATTHTRTKVPDVRWPPLSGAPDSHERQGLITAYWVLKNLYPAELAEEMKDLANTLGHDVLRLELP